MLIKDPVLKEMAEAARNSYTVSLFNVYGLNSKEPSYNSLVSQALSGIMTQTLSPTQAAALVKSGLNSWQYIGSSQCKG
jgi:hypothetical protein